MRSNRNKLNFQYISGAAYLVQCICVREYMCCCICCAMSGLYQGALRAVNGKTNPTYIPFNNQIKGWYPLLAMALLYVFMYVCSVWGLIEDGLESSICVLKIAQSSFSDACFSWNAAARGKSSDIVGRVLWVCAGVGQVGWGKMGWGDCNENNKFPFHRFPGFYLGAKANRAWLYLRL